MKILKSRKVGVKRSHLDHGVDAGDEGNSVMGSEFIR